MLGGNVFEPISKLKRLVSSYSCAVIVTIEENTLVGDFHTVLVQLCNEKQWAWFSSSSKSKKGHQAAYQDGLDRVALCIL